MKKWIYLILAAVLTVTIMIFPEFYSKQVLQILIPNTTKSENLLYDSSNNIFNCIKENKKIKNESLTENQDYLYWESTNSKKTIIVYNKAGFIFTSIDKNMNIKTKFYVHTAIIFDIIIAVVICILVIKFFRYIKSKKKSSPPQEE